MYIFLFVYNVIHLVIILFLFGSFNRINLMPLRKLPTTIQVCCHCVPDLKTAAAIIAVLAIVTSPVMAWAIIRHSYVIRVSCVVSTNSEQTDVLDISLNNVISFGFGANAGLSPSCLSKKSEKVKNGSTGINLTLMSSNHMLENEAMMNAEFTNSDNFIKIARIVGWMVLFADVIVIIISTTFLNYIFEVNNSTKHRITKAFMYCLLLSMLLSFVYGMVYVTTCIVAGGSFPIFEFVFTCFDFCLWLYFLIVVNSYRHTIATYVVVPQQNPQNVPTTTKPT